MTLRWRLFLIVATVVVVAVALTTLTISAAARRSFESLDRERASAFVAQLRREMAQQGEDVARRIERLAASDAAQRTAVEISRHGGDDAPFVGEAASMAAVQGLDFLDLVAEDGTIISSAEWPARFGYRQAWIVAPRQHAAAFLHTIESPRETAVGFVAVRRITAGQRTLFLAGGRYLDEQFLRALTLPDGVRVLLSRGAESGLAPQPAIGALETVHTISLDGEAGEGLGALHVISSRRELAALLTRIRWSGIGFGLLGVVVGAALSYAAATQVTRPIEQVAAAAGRIADGDWNARAGVAGGAREIDALARGFDLMAAELVDHRERLVQAERVAAWRELARRLAHELKNPLFPLRITLDNLRRARPLPPDEFAEVLDESLGTLDTGLRNLNTVVARFGDFAKMPAPVFERVDPNAVVEDAVKLVRAQIEAPGGRPAIRLAMDLDRACGTLRADPEQLARVVQNLLLNAVDAMPAGGDLTVSTRRTGSGMRIDIADTGEGLTDEERARLFTPYYTTKQHGTGLGLAIVQSVVADHSGRVWVDSAKGRGSTFHIELPDNRGASPQGPQA